MADYPTNHNSLPNIPAELVAAIQNARAITILTGAGVSAESGIPTFRDSLTGMWAKYDPMELATPEAFAREPARVTQWYDERRCNVAQCQPNPGHFALAELEEYCTESQKSFTLITQNVDRLHQRAGSHRVIEIHGSLWEWRCTRTGDQREYLEYPFEHYPPKSKAGGLLRPAVVWFGEALPEHEMMMATDAATSCDLFFTIGTSAEVYPAAGLIDVARQRKIRSRTAHTCEINQDPTRHSDRVDWAIHGKSGEVLPALIDRVLER